MSSLQLMILARSFKIRIFEVAAIWLAAAISLPLPRTVSSCADLHVVVSYSPIRKRSDIERTGHYDVLVRNYEKIMNNCSIEASSEQSNSLTRIVRLAWSYLIVDSKIVSFSISVNFLLDCGIKWELNELRMLLSTFPLSLSSDRLSWASFQVLSRT